MPRKPKTDTLEAMATRLEELRSEYDDLVERIRETAERQAREAQQVLERVLSTPGKPRAPKRAPASTAAAPPKPRRAATEASVPERILAWLPSAEARSTLAIAEGLGIQGPNARAQVNVALQRLALRGEIDKVGPAMWQRPRPRAAGPAARPAVDGDEHARAVAWAKANPSDPRASKILAINGG
ncbi:MAG: hypothetical protein JO086_00095 [Acidimicrobiia bacterium]|nr:hypothetical protein [Acidimicrobiia bacterium]